MTTTTHITTAEQLLAAGDIGPCELVKGKLIMMSPAGSYHGAITNELAFRLTQHIKSHRLGRVYAAETGFCLNRNPDTVRAPDISFVAAPRTSPRDSHGFFEGAPDLAVEVLSPDNTLKEIRGKVQDYLMAGAKAVWVVDPRKETVTVHTMDRTAKPAPVLHGNDRLDGGSAVPGFLLVVNELFNINS